MLKKRTKKLPPRAADNVAALARSIDHVRRGLALLSVDPGVMSSARASRVCRDAREGVMLLTSTLLRLHSACRGEVTP